MSQGSFDEYRVGNHDGNLTRFFSEKKDLPCEANEDGNQEKRGSERYYLRNTLIEVKMKR